MGLPSLSHRVALRGGPTSFVYVEPNKRHGGRQTESGSHGVVGMVILKWDDLAWGAGKRSIQNKWEVNTQPQEAINCSKDQLGLSRCSWSPALVLPHLCVCDGAHPCPAGNSGRFSFARQFEGKRGTFQRPLLRPFYPPPTKCRSLDRAITSSWRGSAFTGGGDKTGSLSCETPPRLPPSMHSLHLIALFTPRHSQDKTVKIKVNHRRGSRRTTHNHRKLHLLRKNKNRQGI